MLQYVLKLTISLPIVYIFYQLFLRRLTFYNWNRWYLLIYSMVCFVIPFVNVFTIIIKEPALRESAFVNYIPAITQMKVTGRTTNSTGIDWLLITGVVIVTGIIAMAVRLLVQYYSLFKMKKKAVLLYDDNVKLYHIDAPVIPFSFGRGIYVNQHQHSEAELKEIIRHEFIHVKQRHSLDIIWSEMLCMLNWFNPFAWLLRHDIRQNLEFIADQQVLQTGLDRKQYQYLLLKVIGASSFSIAASFNFSSLKKRIAMMNKAQSARVHLIRFLFLLPLLVVVLLAFRNSTQGHYQSLRTAVTDTVPAGSQPPIPPPPTPPVAPARVEKEVPKAPGKLKLHKAPEKPEAPEMVEKVDILETPVPPPPPPPVAVHVNHYNEKGYCITVVDNFGESIVIVKNKDNKIVQALSLTDWNNDKQYEEKYGEAPLRLQEIRIAPKSVTGFKVKPVTAVIVKPVTGVSNNEVVVIGKPMGIATNPKPAVKLVLDKKVAVAPDKAYLLIRDGGPAPKIAAQPKEAAEARAKGAAETKAAAEAKPQPAAPAKEQ